MLKQNTFSEKLKPDEIFALIIIPFVNAITHSTAGYFIGETASFDIGLLSPGYIRGALVFAFIFYFLVFKKMSDTVSKSTFYFGVYILISSLWSPILSTSVYVAFKVFSWVAMYAIGFYYIKNIERLLLFFKFYIINYLLIFVGVIVSNIFQIGWGWYAGDEIRTGGQGAEVVTHFGHLFFFIPLFMSLNKDRLWKYLSAILLTLALMYIAFAGKRGTFLGLAVTLIVYMLLTPRKKVILYAVPIILFAVVIFITFFYEIAAEQYLTRGDAYQIQYADVLEREARYFEIIYTFDAVHKDIQTLIFGNGYFSELYYSVALIGRPRMNHIDYFSILYGSGYLGLLWFVLFHIQIWSKVYSLKKVIRTTFSKEVFVIITCSLIYLAIVALSSTVTNVDHRTNVFMLYGGFIGILTAQSKLNKNQQEVK